MQALGIERDRAKVLLEATQRQYVETKAELDTVLAVLQQLVDGPSGGLGLHESAVVKARAILTKHGR